MKIGNQFNSVYSNNFNRNYTQDKNINFKSLTFEEKTLEFLDKNNKPFLDYIMTFADELNHFKFWDIKVTLDKLNKICFSVASKLSNNEYEVLPEEVEILPRNPKFTCPDLFSTDFFCKMTIPHYLENTKGFDKEVFSEKDWDAGEKEQLLYLPYQDMREAVETNQSLMDLAEDAINSEESYADLAVILAQEFETASERKAIRESIEEAFAEEEENETSETNGGVERNTKRSDDDDSDLTETFIVKKGNADILNGSITASELDKNSGFAKVSGMVDLKKTLMEDVILPLRNVELYKKYGLKPANGVILYGPPGTGKTFISEALAEESGRTYLKLDVPSIESKWVGETPKNIENAFKEAQENAPSIIFIDEIEALTPERGDMDSSSAGIGYNQNVSTFLQHLNNCSEKGVFVVAATNQPQKVDKAVIRTGRFDKTIFVPPPDLEARIELFKTNIESIYADKDIDYNKLATMTENYTAPEIINLVIREAAKEALKRNEPVSEEDLIKHIKLNPPQLNKNIVESYKNRLPNKQNSQNQRIGFTQ